MSTEYGALLDAVRGVRWPARRSVRGSVPGVHLSRMRGTSAEFTEYRPYRQGDDPAKIDWKLFARSDRPYIRLSTDRATLPTNIVVDASASMAFPSPSLGKWELARQLTVAFAAVAHAAGDPVGLLIAQGAEPTQLPPRTRRSVVAEVTRSVVQTTPDGTAPLAPLVAHATRSAARLVLLTDFLGDADALLSVVSRFIAAGGEVHAIHIVAEQELHPGMKDQFVTDPEDDDIRRPLTAATHDEYLHNFAAWRAGLAHAWRAAGVAFHVAVTDAEPTEHIVLRVADPRVDLSRQ